MKVKELIKQLNEYPEDWDVAVDTQGLPSTWWTVTEVYTETKGEVLLNLE